MKKIAVTLLFLSACALAQPLRPMVGHDQTITAAPGEDLYSLGRHYRLGLEHLAFANNLAVSLAPVGPTSLVLPGRRILPANPPADGLVLNLPDVELALDDQGGIREARPEDQSFSHTIIEMFMVEANEAA